MTAKEEIKAKLMSTKQPDKAAMQTNLNDDMKEKLRNKILAMMNSKFSNARIGR